MWRQFFPKRRRIAGLRPWVVALIVFFVCWIGLDFLASESRSTASPTTVMGGVISFLIETEEGVVVQDPERHGSISSQKMVGGLLIDFPDAGGLHPRGQMMTGNRIIVRTDVRGTPLDVDRILQLIEPLQRKYDFQVGRLLERRQDGETVFADARDPRRIRSVGVALCSAFGLLVLFLFWTIGWQLALIVDARRAKRS